MKKPKKFWSQVDMSGDCWEWMGFRNIDGYGVYFRNGNNMAHRYAWEAVKGERIGAMVAMHICDNPGCCNPDHIAIGTHSENQADKFKKGRQARGESIGISKLTEADVLEIRKKHKPRKITYKILADEYGVCVDTVRKAICGINWKHV